MQEPPQQEKENNMFDDIEFNIKEYAIGGKMVTGKCLVSDSQYMSISIPDKELKVAIKKDLAKQLAIHLIENKLVEFTMIKDPVDMSRMYHVRCFVTPDEQVRLLRTHEKNIL